MIQRALAEAHVDAHGVVGGVDVLHILAHFAALDLVLLQVGGGHHHQVGVQLHHQGDDLAWADVVGHDAGLLLRQGEDLILRVVGDVVDLHVGAAQQLLHNVLVVLPEAALFRVEHHMLVQHREEPLVVLLFPLGMGILAEQSAALFAAGQVFHFLQGSAALFQLGIVHKLLGVDGHIQQVHLHDGDQVAGDPVQADAGRNEEAQVQRQAYGNGHGAVFVHLALLGLQHLVVVLGHAHDPCAQRGQHGHDQRDAQHFRGNPAQVQPQEVHLEGLQLRHDGRHVAALQSQEGILVSRVLDGVHHRHLDGGRQNIRAGEFARQGHHGGGELLRQAEDVAQGVVDHFHQAQQDHHLHQQGDHAGQGVVFVFLIDVSLLFGNGIQIAEVVHLQPVDLRLHLHQLDAVFLHPDGNGQQHHL